MQHNRYSAGATRWNVAFLDYSVAKEGQLMAYRWNREKKLVREKFAYASAYLRFFIVTNDGGELSDAITEGLFLCNKKCNKSGSLNSLNLD